jgi:glycogen debranching enzyme
MATATQPFLHDLVTCLHAPTVVLGGQDGQVREKGAQGALHADVRVLSRALVTVEGIEPEPLSSALGRDSGSARFTAVVRPLGAPGADPTAVLERRREVKAGSLAEWLVLLNGGDQPVAAQVRLDLAADHASIDAIKAGRPEGRASLRRRDRTVIGWCGAGVDVELSAPGATVAEAGSASTGVVRVTLTWVLDVPARGCAEVSWGLRVDDPTAVVVAAPDEPTWSTPLVEADDPRLAALVERSLSDLAALRMVLADRPQDVFCAAGSPWFFTLFGRDSLWTARMLLPLGTDLARGTLRVLAAHQGRVHDPATGEAPGKIPHELRRGCTSHPESSLPPLYYGTVDATPLWVVLLHDAWRWGLADADVRELLPALRAALEWVVEHGDTDGDGFLEYVDHSGKGLANQGWKDSGDAIRFADGSAAEGPVALCEVQGYAYEAAVAGAALLDALGEPGADRLRLWARELAGELVRELLDASSCFEARLPELLGGQGVDEGLGVQPYPASCRPQAWSAAAAVVLLQAVLGLRPDLPAGQVEARPCGGSPVGAVRVEGLVVGGAPATIAVDRQARVVHGVRQGSPGVSGRGQDQR